MSGPPGALAVTQSLLPNPESRPRAAPVPRDSLVTVLGVVYVHRKTSDGGDLYLTRYGLPLRALLEPENWYEKSWFDAHRER